MKVLKEEAVDKELIQKMYNKVRYSSRRFLSDLSNLQHVVPEEIEAPINTTAEEIERAVKELENKLIQTKILQEAQVNADRKTSAREALGEDLALVPEGPSDETPATPEANGVAKLILDAINDESDTIKMYNDLIVNTDDADIIQIIQDITAEENNHIGMLQKALEIVSPNASNIEDGVEEAESMINESINLKNYNNCYVELRDGEPSFCYDKFIDAKDGVFNSKAGDVQFGDEEHEYEIKYLKDGNLYPIGNDGEVITESLNEDVWFGKYKDTNNKIHKVYFNFDSTDFDEAEEEFNEIIPDSYVKAKLYGRSLEQPLIKDGFVKIGESMDEKFVGSPHEAHYKNHIIKRDITDSFWEIENNGGDVVADNFDTILDAKNYLDTEDLNEDLHDKFKRDIKKAYKDWAAANERNEQKRKEAQDFIPDEATEEQIAKYNDWINNQYPQVEFKYDFPRNIEKEDYPFYVTYYSEYPIYEPAEGGYYYPGRDAIWSKGFNTEEEATEFMENEVANDDYIDNWERYTNGYISRGEYIGQDQMIVIEPKNAYLSEIAGYEPYQ